MMNLNKISSHYKIPLNILFKYPFLNHVKVLISKENNIVFDIFKDKIDKGDLKQIFIDSLEYKEETSGFKKNKKDFYLFPWIKIILGIIDNENFLHKVANLISKHFGLLLQEEDINILLQIAKDQEITISFLENDEIFYFKSLKFEYYMNFLEYIKYAVLFQSPAWKLVNRLIKDGKVFLMKKDIARIIEENIKNNLLKLEQNKLDKKIKAEFLSHSDIKEFIQDLKELINKKYQESDFNQDFPSIIDNNNFPPCLKFIFVKLVKGKNLTHTERLFLTFFLINIGSSEEYILSLFRNQPDFNQDKTSYYIQHAEGKKGKGTKYKPHNCKILESYGICKKNDDYLCLKAKYPLKNPLTYYKIKIKNKKKDENEEKSLKKN